MFTPELQTKQQMSHTPAYVTTTPQLLDKTGMEQGKFVLSSAPELGRDPGSHTLLIFMSLSGKRMETITGN